MDKIILKVQWKGKRTRMAKTKLEKEELSGKNQHTHFQDYSSQDDVVLAEG